MCIYRGDVFDADWLTVESLVSESLHSACVQVRGQRHGDPPNQKQPVYSARRPTGRPLSVRVRQAPLLCSGPPQSSSWGASPLHAPLYTWLNLLLVHFNDIELNQVCLEQAYN